MVSAGLDLPPAGSRVVVAMSGGVDSSVAAAVLAAAGFEVVGITLQLYDHGAAIGRAGSCCAGQDIHDARRVAERLAIPHYVLDYEDRFRREVIDAFADSYARGETPIPCVACNRTVKFRDLTRMAQDLGAAALATGHYARRLQGPAGPELRQGADPARDQSYFLFATTRAQLDYLRFPLGAATKAETRALAERFGLAVAAKADSQDICFVPNGGYADLVGRLRPEAAEPGEIVDGAGRVLGTHPGVIHFTVGQRRGLKLGSHAAGGGEPLYVARLDPAERRVVVGPRAALGVGRVRLREVNWLGSGDGPPAEGMALRVKVRSATPAVAARVHGRPGAEAEVVFATPQTGVAPGQACVFYDGDRLLGGGWIVREACPAPRSC